MLPGDLSERMLRALVIQMLRSGALPREDIDAAVEQLRRDDDKEAAHALNCILMRSMLPDQSDMDADFRRRKFRVISDGGKVDD